MNERGKAKANFDQTYLFNVQSTTAAAISKWSQLFFSTYLHVHKDLLNRKINLRLVDKNLDQMCRVDSVDLTLWLTWRKD